MLLLSVFVITYIKGVIALKKYLMGGGELKEKEGMYGFKILRIDNKALSNTNQKSIWNIFKETARTAFLVRLSGVFPATFLKILNCQCSALPVL